MKLLIVFILQLFLITSAYPQFDFSYGTSLRSYPGLGGDLNAQVGYNIPLYGQPGPGSPIVSGLIRPSIKGGHSGVVSNYDTRLSFYPLSFIGLGAGRKEYTSNYEDFSYYDCQKIRCKGSLNKDYSFGKIALGLGNFLTTFSYKEFRNNYSSEELNSKPVAEYEFALEVSPKNETEIERTYFIGHKLGESYIGILSTSTEFLSSDKHFQMNIGIYQAGFSIFKVTYGIGNLYSSDIKPGAVGIIRISHQVLPELALF